MKQFATELVGVYEDDNAIIGVVCPPEEMYNSQHEVELTIKKLWDEWHEEVEFPDTDYDFVLWLKENHGWEVIDPYPTLILR